MKYLMLFTHLKILINYLKIMNKVIIFLKHDTNKSSIKFIIRCILFPNNASFSKFQNNRFKFKNMDDLRIISE